MRIAYAQYRVKGATLYTPIDGRSEGKVRGEGIGIKDGVVVGARFLNLYACAEQAVTRREVKRL